MPHTLVFTNAITIAHAIMWNNNIHHFLHLFQTNGNFQKKKNGKRRKTEMEKKSESGFKVKQLVSQIQDAILIM